jgi:DNA-binding transcriptional regulator YiaG
MTPPNRQTGNRPQSAPTAGNIQNMMPAGKKRAAATQLGAIAGQARKAAATIGTVVLPDGSRVQAKVVNASAMMRRDKAAPAAGSTIIKIGPKSVTVVRESFGVTQEEFGRVMGYSTRSVAAWEGGLGLSDSARQKLVETIRLQAALAKIVPEKELGEWMRNPNPAFEGQAPLQIIERGESDRIWRMIFQIDAGVAS